MNGYYPIKIAFLTAEYPHPRTPGLCGGIGTSIMNLATEMAKKSQVSILVYGQEEDEIFDENGLTFYRIKNSTSKRLPWFFTQKKIESLINKLVRERKINVVEAADWTGVTAFINAKCPIAVRLHGSETYFSHFSKLPVKWRVRFCEKMALKRADVLISVSRYTADVTKSIIKLKKEFTIIPNGVQIKNFEAMSDPDSENPVILYFGTLVRKKGAFELPLIFNKVFEKNPHAKLVLVGLNSDDPTTGNPSVWQMMQALFSPEALPNVSYPGSVPYSEIRKYISRSTACVFPTFAEALPVSWIEAMAMGKSIVASNIGWAEELIDDRKEGFLVHPTQHQEFANKILALLLDKDLRLNFGAAAREKAINKFSVEVVAAQNLEFYNTIVGK